MSMIQPEVRVDLPQGGLVILDAGTAYEQGRQSFRKALVNYNPFPKDTPLYWEFQSGWAYEYMSQ